MTGDEYLQAQIQPMLQPGEQVLHTAYMRRQPGLLVQMFLVGGLLLFLMTKAYFAVLTNRRLIFIRTKMGFWKGGPQQQNLGIEQYDVRALTKITVGGIANNKSMTFHFSNGPAQTLRISPWFKQVNGTKAFLEQLPGLVASGQLAQMAGGALPPGAQGQLPAGPPPQQMQPPMGQPQMQQPQMQQPQQQMQQPQQQMQPQHGAPPQQHGAPPQQHGAPPQQHGAPPQQQHGAPPPQGFSPGMQVFVAPGDGQRYPATVVSAANGQYQCMMPNGQPYWFPAQNISQS